MTESENENDHFDLDHFDHILASLLTLGIAHTNMSLPLINRRLDHFDQHFSLFRHYSLCFPRKS